MKTLLTAIVALIALSSTTGFTEEAAQNEMTAQKVIKDEKSCKAEGGDWRRVGQLGIFSCVLKANDAGKSCTDASQCEYNCIAKEGDEPKPGESATGVCQAESVLPSCFTLIVNGIAGGQVCA